LCSSNALSLVEAEKQRSSDQVGITPGLRAGVADLEIDGWSLQ
jgi:hypothetical protein